MTHPTPDRAGQPSAPEPSQDAWRIAWLIADSWDASECPERFAAEQIDALLQSAAERARKRVSMEWANRLQSFAYQSTRDEAKSLRHVRYEIGRGFLPSITKEPHYYSDEQIRALGAGNEGEWNNG